MYHKMSCCIFADTCPKFTDRLPTTGTGAASEAPRNGWSSRTFSNLGNKTIIFVRFLFVFVHSLVEVIFMRSHVVVLASQ
jgi:hypothetical protein